MKSLSSFLFLVACLCGLTTADAQQPKPIFACLGHAKIEVGYHLKLRLAKEANIKKDTNDDTFSYRVTFDGQPKTVSFQGAYGAETTSGFVPKPWLVESTNVVDRPRVYNGIKINDTRGRLENGNLWRFIGLYGESIRYYDVPRGDAALLDTLFDQVCYDESASY